MFFCIEEKDAYLTNSYFDCTFQKALHSAWKDISVLRDSVSFKRSKLQLQKQKLKNFAILKGQVNDMITYSHFSLVFSFPETCIGIEYSKLI